MRVALLLFMLPLVAAAETAYVTDNLRLGLHEAADTSDRAFRTLESGQELEILSRNRNYARVRLPDGTLGNVKVAYLVFDKPAKLIVAETQAANAALQKEIADTKQAFAVPAATIAQLKEQVVTLQTTMEENDARMLELTEQNESYQSRHEQFKYSLPVSWVSAAMLVCLIVGFLAGLWWLDYRSRKRHGGIRIY